MYEEVQDLASGILKLNLAPVVQEYKHYSLQPVGIYSINREEWAMLDAAAILYKFTLVPLYATLGEENL